jgi:phospholipid/cholesterol/gamma-HCH transport system substrate-binding protein
MRARVIVAVLAIALGAVAIGAGALVYRAVAGDPGGRTWTAEFTNARGLVAGNDVRDDGAVVGRVTSIGLSRDGTALVRFQLSNPAAAPRADAVAAIQAADLLGDNYLSLSPGGVRAPLRGPIPTARTVDAPRLDQLLDAFQPNVRDGLQTLLVEGGLALDRRGGALARTTVGLRPALQAAGGVLHELDTQNGSLARLIPNAERVAAQLGSRSSDVGPLLDDLSRTLGVTAAAATPLGQGLTALPATLAGLRGTARGLAGTASAATGLASRLEPATAALAGAVRGLPALAGRARAAAPTFAAALAAAGSSLTAGAPGLRELSSAFPTLRAQAPSIATLLAELDQAAPGIAQGFFVDFPDQAAESGRQPFDPFADPRRAYWRGAAVFSCEAFGVPVAPGCLERALANLARQPPPQSGSARRLLGFLLRR